MDYYPIIAANCQSSIESISLAVDDLAEPIGLAAQRICQALLEDRKLLCCGVGADSALSQLMVTNMLTHFEHDRPALPALALANDGAMAIASSGDPDDSYGRQLRALGQAGDVLLCISSGAGHGCMTQAVLSAHERNMDVIALSNSRDDRLAGALSNHDILIGVPAARQPRVLELQLLALHCLCELIDHSLFGNYSGDNV